MVMLLAPETGMRSSEPSTKGDNICDLVIDGPPCLCSAGVSVPVRRCIQASTVLPRSLSRETGGGMLGICTSKLQRLTLTLLKSTKPWSLYENYNLP